MNQPTVISVQNVTKHFSLPRRKDETILSHIVHTVSKTPSHTVEHRKVAVRDVSFSVKRGEVCGIIGKNASGKTTLLRMVAGILEPDAGSINVQGDIISLINLSVGINTRLTVRDNIYLACSLFGMSRGETKRKFADIIEFGELEEYVDMFPYQLSMGMNQRLAFSIAIHSDPEILLLDEVFSAGDIGFRMKAEERMKALISSDVTVVMITHDMDKIRQLADNVLWLEDGAVQKFGEPSEVIQAYIEAMLGDNVAAS